MTRRLRALLALPMIALAAPTAALLAGDPAVATHAPVAILVGEDQDGQPFYREVHEGEADHPGGVPFAAIYCTPNPVCTTGVHTYTTRRFHGFALTVPLPRQYAAVSSLTAPDGADELMGENDHGPIRVFVAYHTSGGFPNTQVLGWRQPPDMPTEHHCSAVQDGGVAIRCFVSHD